jgi:tetratricopeptide (TPR) repeat protein
MIVKNERAHLARCLESARNLADEMIVIDTGSTDDTPAIARACGAVVVQSAWHHDFSRARNESLSAARGAWILVLDADEFVAPGEAEKIRALLNKHTDAAGRATAAFNLVVQCTAAGGRPGMLAHIVRLFPNRPDVRYEWPIHEQVVTSLTRAKIPVLTADARLVHTGYEEPARNRDKQIRNRDILQAQLDADREVGAMTFFLLGGCHLDLGDPVKALEFYRRSRDRALAEEHDAQLTRAATVRIATCLLALGRAAEAIAEMPAAWDDTWHPELVALRATAAAQLGRAEEARAWHERVLGCADEPQIPPYDLIQLKCDALTALATHWRALGKPALGVTLLRAALALKQEGRAFGPAELAKAYASGS